MFTRSLERTTSGTRLTPTRLSSHDLLGLTAGDTGHRLLPGGVGTVAEVECVSTESASIKAERDVRGDAATEDDGHDRVCRFVSSDRPTQFGITERAGHAICRSLS